MRTNSASHWIPRKKHGTQSDWGGLQDDKSFELLITADSGGGNASKNKLWKGELQKLADETGLTIHVCHFPPGTSKWNKIEHQMFSYISKNWRGKPFIDKMTVVQFIRNTITTTGLKIKCVLDETTYEKGIKISYEELTQVNITHDGFHPEWNYKIISQQSIS